MDTKHKTLRKTGSKLINKSPIRPSLGKFLLSGISLEQTLDSKKSGKGTMYMSLSKNVTMELLAPALNDTKPRLNVSIEIQIDGTEEEDSGIFIKVKAAYCGKFTFPSRYARNKAVAYLSDEENQETIISQVMPLAMTHIKAQLDLIGMTNKSIPISG